MTCPTLRNFWRSRSLVYVIAGFALLACMPTAASGQAGAVCPGQGAPNTNDPGTPPNCHVSCVGDNYDVDNNASNGCEVPNGGIGSGHDQSIANVRPALSCPGGSTDVIQGILPSDSRVHFPPVGNFNATVGAAPQWFSTATQGNIFCASSYWARLIVGSHFPNCYKLTVITDKRTDSAIVDATGVATLNIAAPAFTFGTTIYFKIEKVCALPAQEIAIYTLNYNFTAPPSPPPAPTIPTAPSGITAKSAVGGITASWGAVSGATTYNLKTATSASGPFTVAQSAIGGTSVTVTSLTPNTTYYVVVSAVNSAGESPNSSSPASVLTPPAVPTNVSQFGAAPGYIGIMWLSSPGATSYLLNLGGANFTTTAAAANCTPSVQSMCIYGAGGFPSGTQTGCSVAAVNASGGQSAFSGAVFCAAQ